MDPPTKWNTFLSTKTKPSISSLSSTVPPSFLIGRTDAEDGQYFQAEVFLREGGQNYDVMDWTQEDLIQDIIDQYERHLHFLNIVRS